MAWRSHRWPEMPNQAAATNNLRSATFRPAEARGSGRGQSRAYGGPPPPGGERGGVVRVAAFRHAPAGCFGRNLGRRREGERGGGWWGKRGLKFQPPPTTSANMQGTVAARGKPAYSRVGAEILPRPSNFFAGRPRLRGLFGRDFSAPTRILAVILWVGAFCGVC